MNETGDHGEAPLTLREVVSWAEFGCWVTLGLTPMLYFVNGPAVSQDQFVMRVAIVSVAASGAFCLLLRRLLSRKRLGASFKRSATESG